MGACMANKRTGSDSLRRRSPQRWESEITNMLKRAFVITVLLVTTGCSRLYVIREHVAERPSSELITVRGQDPTLFLVSVDGRSKEYGPAIFRGPFVYPGFELLLDPGEHTIGVYHATAMHVHNVGTWTTRTEPRYFKFNGSPGSTYEVFIVRERNSIRMDIRQVE